MRQNISVSILGFVHVPYILFSGDQVYMGFKWKWMCSGQVTKLWSCQVPEGNEDSPLFWPGCNGLHQGVSDSCKMHLWSLSFFSICFFSLLYATNVHTKQSELLWYFLKKAALMSILQSVWHFMALSELCFVLSSTSFKMVTFLRSLSKSS